MMALATANRLEVLSPESDDLTVMDSSRGCGLQQAIAWFSLYRYVSG
jgi:hypothetical protein